MKTMFEFLKKGEGKESFGVGPLVFALYGLIRWRRFRKLLRKLILRLEGGQIYSVTIRKIFSKYHNVQIGMYTHGSCFEEGNFDRYTTVGRYCSIAADVHVFNRNHPMDFKSTHAFFFNPLLKLTKKDLVEYTPLEIGNDVWIGYGVVILPNVTKIGDGAVIGAGCVVSKNIPPYAVMVGHPVRLVRYRFSKETIDQLLKEKWWEKEIREILPNIQEYQRPYGTEGNEFQADIKEQP